MRLLCPAVRRASAALAVGLFMFVGACVGVEGVWIAEGFSWGGLREDGLVVGGVVSAVSEQDRSEELPRAALLRDSLRDGDDGLPAQDAQELVLLLGPERHAELMEEYRTEGSVCSESLAEVAQCGIGDRYLVLARITRDEVDESKTSKYDQETEKRTYTKSTTREVDAIAHVFDLNAGTLAWRAQSSHRLGRGVNYEEEEQESKGFFERVVGTILGIGETPEPEYPDPPATTSVLRPILDALVKELKKA